MTTDWLKPKGTELCVTVPLLSSPEPDSEFCALMFYFQKSVNTHTSVHIPWFSLTGESWMVLTRIRWQLGDSMEQRFVELSSLSLSGQKALTRCSVCEAPCSGLAKEGLVTAGTGTPSLLTPLHCVEFLLWAGLCLCLPVWGVLCSFVMFSSGWGDMAVSKWWKHIWNKLEDLACVTEKCYPLNLKEQSILFRPDKTLERVLFVWLFSP